MLVAPVRTGLPRFVRLHATEDATLRRGERVVCRTPRGTEMGEVLLPPREAASEISTPPRGPADDGHAVLRRATAADLALARDLSETWEPLALRFARRLQRELELGGRIIATEHLFGGERIVYYFLAEARVELGPLARSLEAELGRAIEVRQVGARDAARLLGDVGPCGIAACGREFLGERPPAVTLRDVLPQRGALDGTKLHGWCGLLKDCLRFEADSYRGAGPQIEAESAFAGDEGAQVEIASDDDGPLPDADDEQDPAEREE